MARSSRSPLCAPRDNSLAVSVLNTDGTGERALTKPGSVEMQGFDWSKDSQAILGACRFHQSERYSTCLLSVSSANEERRSECPGHCVGSKAQSLQPAILSRSTLDHVPRARSVVRLDVDRLRRHRRPVAPGGRSPTARGLTTSRGGGPTDGSSTSCRTAPALRTSGDGDSIARPARQLASPFPSHRSDPRNSS